MTHRLLFDDTFADRIASGVKRCTIRRMSDDLPSPGDRLCLWQPHPTLPQQLIRDDVICTAVRPIRIWRSDPTWISVDLDGRRLILSQLRVLALADGFERVMDFLRHFERKGLPFEGALIEWAQDGAKQQALRGTFCPLVGCRDNCNTCGIVH